ncbi:MAG: hypothetical protein JO053_07370 [Acidobacteria bacterium]|nr:hypothetical protein [Acidobacteriota bacterium]
MTLPIKSISHHVLLSLAVLSVMLSASAFAKAQPGTKTPFTGVWDTRVEGTYKYTVRLTQIGNKVTGTYTPGNGKIFGGIVVGKTLTFKLTQDGGYEGTGVFTLDDDGKGFTGSSTTTKPVPQTHTWNTYRPPPPSLFAGTWMLANNLGLRIPLTIVQNGNKATGLYTAQNGALEGAVDGKILRFTWKSNKGSGSGEFNISNSGETFAATFKKANGTEITDSGTWGERTTATGEGVISGQTPTTPNQVPEPAASVGGSGGKTMASFAGSWLITEGGIPGGMDLTQSGSAVTGYYATNLGSYELIDGKVNGGILRFKLVARTAKGALKVGEVVMERDGKSFKGTVGGLIVTGTLRP